MDKNEGVVGAVVVSGGIASSGTYDGISIKTGIGTSVWIWTGMSGRVGRSEDDGPLGGYVVVFPVFV